MWKAQTIYLIIKTRKFNRFFNGHSKLPFLWQILHVSHLQHDVIEIYDVKYLCLNFGWNMLKRTRSKVVILSQCLVKAHHNAIQESHMTNPQKESFQKYIRCWVIEDQSRKVESFDVSHAVRSYLIWQYVILLKMLRN